VFINLRLLGKDEIRKYKDAKKCRIEQVIEDKGGGVK